MNLFKDYLNPVKLVKNALNLLLYDCPVVGSLKFTFQSL